MTDASGNTQSCNFDITVTDEEDPTISCVGDQNKATDSGDCDYTVQGTEFNPTTFDDNCTGATISNDYNNSDSLTGATFPLGTTNVIWKVTDASGNTQTCNFDITVTDEEDPTISCVVDQNKATDSGNCDYTVQGTEFNPTTFDDNCTGATISNNYNNSDTLAGATFPLGTTNVIWTVTDASGNTQTCSFDITVTDEEDPTISCVGDQNKATDSGNCDYTVQGTEFNPTTFDDNCTGATISNNYNNSDTLAGATFPLGTTNVIWTVTDASGNTQTCNFDVIVTDEEDPTISCVGDQNKATDSGNCDYTVQGTEFNPTTFDDNCTGANISNNYNNSNSLAGASFPLGTTNVIWTVADASGNTQSCNFDVIVTDEEDPTISCVGDQIKSTDIDQCYYTVVGIEFDPTSTNDNCSISSVVNDFNSGSSLEGAQIPDGTTIVWTITDSNSNTNSCSFTVTVNDTQVPTILELPDLTAECSITLTPPTTTDNCDAVVTGTTGIDLLVEESTTVFWIFEDESGNTTDPVAQQVTIEDTQNPVPDQSSLPKKVLTGCQISGISELDIPTATDACDGTILGKLSDDFEFPYSFFGTNTVTWEFIDESGNITLQTQDIQLNPVAIDGGVLKGFLNSTEFQNQIDVSSCFASISVDLELTGKNGTIVQWEKYAVNEGSWEVINNTIHLTQQTLLQELWSLLIFRVLVQTGTCSEYSESFYIRALPAGDAPTVTNLDDDNKYCLGEDVNLLAESNYLATQPAIPSSMSPGDFNQGQLNTQDPDSWLVDGDTGGFSAGGNSKKPRNWSGTNDHQFGNITFDSKDFKFAIAQGDFSDNKYKGNSPTTLESPILDLSQAEFSSLDFDQAFYFANNDIAIIEISTDGGNTYSTLRLMHGAGAGVKKWFTAGTAESTAGSDATNYNFNTDNTSISLDDYVGESQVRIRWSFIGTSDDSVWAMDNIFFSSQVFVDTELEWTNGIGNPRGKSN